MLDIKFIKENIDEIKDACLYKNIKIDIDKLVKLEEEKRHLQTKIETLRAKKNEISNRMKQDRDKGLIDQSKLIKEELEKMEKQIKQAKEDFEEIYFQVPNIVSPKTPKNKNPEGNKIIKTVGNIPKFNFEIKNHIDLGLDLDILDLERGVKVHGFRGYFLKNEGAMLHFAIVNYAFEKIIKKGYIPMITPNLVKDFAFFGSGFFPYQKDEVFKIEKDNLYLAGTSELALLGYYSNEILDKKSLPIKMCAFSPCFRSEVGSYGKDTKGLYRIHEFLKIEQLVICENDHKKAENHFDEMLSISESIVKDLKLPYRVVNLCTADMGAGKYYANDIETYMPSRKDYGETHSCSNLTDWQTRRSNIRFSNKEGEKNYCFALNNTVVASPRILIAILENYQQKDGSVKIPKVLQKYMPNKKSIIKIKKNKNAS